MRLWIFGLLFPVWLLGADLSQQLFSLENKTTRDQFPAYQSIVARGNALSAIALLVYKTTDGGLKTVTGFFIDDDLVLTALHPKGSEGIDCQTMKVYASITSAKVSGIESEQSYGCKAILLSEREYGMAMIRIAGSHPHFLALPSSELEPYVPYEKVEAHSAEPHVSTYSAVGYSDDAGIFLSVGCTLEAKCIICANAKLRINPVAWTQSDCLFRKGMAGGPLLKPGKNGSWEVVGMLSTVVAGGDAFTRVYAQVAVIKMAALQREFGFDLKRSRK